MSSPTIERASASDMMELASATTPAAGQIGAILMLAPAGGLSLDEIRSALADRIVGVARLRQQLQRAKSGAGDRSGSTIPSSTSSTTSTKWCARDPATEAHSSPSSLTLSAAA